MSEQRMMSRTELAEALDGSPLIMSTELGDHLGSDRLVEYHRGKLDDDDAKATEDHLVACSRCRESLLDLDAMVRAPHEGAAGIASLATETAWRDLQSRRGASTEAGELEIPAPSTGGFETVPAGGWRALAAALILACLGLGAWSLQQRSTILQFAELGSSRPPVVLQERQRGDVTVISFPDGDDDFKRIQLILPVPPQRDLAAFEGFEAEIRRTDGTVATRKPIPLRLHGSEFRIDGTRRSLPRGRFVVTVYGMKGGERVGTIVEREAIFDTEQESANGP